MKHQLNYFTSILILSLFSFSGCGYKPTSYYAKNEIKGKVYIQSSIDIDNSENSILIRDVVNELVISKFDTTIVNKKDISDMVITASLNSVTHTGLETSEDGYTTLYRATVSISISYKENRTNGKNKTVTVTNYYDYAVDSDSVVSSEKKLEAVRLASSKALTDIFSKIAIQVFKN